MDDFEQEMKMSFLQEASQLLGETEQCFLDLESNPGDVSILEKIFRLAHNMKGSSKAVGFDQLGAFTHEFESFLLKVKNGEIPLNKPVVSLLLRCNDLLGQSVEALMSDLNAPLDGSALLADMEKFKAGEFSEEVPELEREPEYAAPEPEPVSEPVPAEPVALTSEQYEANHQAALLAQLEADMNPGKVAQAPDLVQPQAVVEQKPKLAVVQAPSAAIPVSQVTPISDAHPGSKAQAPKADESIRVSLSRVEKLLNYVGEMVILQTVLREQSGSGNPLLLRKTIHQLGKVTKEVQDISMSLRMVPLKQTFQKMQRIVRDTSGSLNKVIHFNLAGEDTEVDKTILESLGDPLVHLIRNAVDHGVESGADRIAKGKPEAGTVNLSAYHRSGHLVIEVRDDGAGMDAKKLKAKAVEKGLIKANAELSEQDCYQLIFQSGFSTKAVVTDVSGRGVGMDVVKTNIAAIQGQVLIETELGKGTCFKVQLPLTLAIIDAMVVKTNKERYVIPLAHVHESVRPTKADIHWLTGLGEVFCLRGENLPLFRLSQILGKKTAENDPASEGIAIVVRFGGSPFAVIVEDIIGQQQVVVKRLGDEHKGLKGFSGSAILGDGRPSLILELLELVERNKQSGGSSQNRTTTAPAQKKLPENRERKVA